MAFLYSVNMDGKRGPLRIKKNKIKFWQKHLHNLNILQHRLNTKSTFLDCNLQCFMYICLSDFQIVFCFKLKFLMILVRWFVWFIAYNS